MIDFFLEDFFIILSGLCLGFIFIKKYSKKILVISILIYFLGMFADSLLTWYILENRFIRIGRERNYLIRELYIEHGSLSAFFIFSVPEYWGISLLIFLGTLIPLSIASKFNKKMLPLTFFSLGMLRFIITFINFLIFLKI